MLQISHINLFVASNVFGDIAITSASGSGFPGRLLFFLTFLGGGGGGGCWGGERILVFCSINGLKLERVASSDKVELDIAAWNIVSLQETSKQSKTKYPQTEISELFGVLFDI